MPLSTTTFTSQKLLAPNEVSCQMLKIGETIGEQNMVCCQIRIYDKVKCACAHVHTHTHTLLFSRVLIVEI